MKEVAMTEQHYNLLKKHLCKEDSRLALQYIQNKGGYAYATDGKRLVRIKDAFNDLPDGVYMPMNTPKKSRTGIVMVIMKEGVDIQFPDCDVIWPKEVSKQEEKIYISQEFISKVILDIYHISGCAVKHAYLEDLCTKYEEAWNILVKSGISNQTVWLQSGDIDVLIMPFLYKKPEVEAQKVEVSNGA